ncbi:MAG: DUF3618 domain-containing protein, partial [Acidobacteria bacterium]|nr:DUF3618 domain-containing protein [Acidobacteriota bacterium]
MERPHGELTPSQGQLKAEIHETQSELQQTVAEIQERLSPTNLKEQAANTVRDATIGRVQDMMNRAEGTVSQAVETTRNAASTATRSVRNNPMPLALIGIGVAWLLASKRQRSDEWDNRGLREWPEPRVGSTTSTGDT